MSGNTLCLLVVDDEADFRLLFSRHFQRLGYRVLEAENGDQALDLFGEHHHEIDLVVTDIRMPKMGGEQLVSELRRRRPLLPIIGITGHADLADEIASLGDGAYYHLGKPIESWSIVERLIENAIRVQQLESEIEDS